MFVILDIQEKRVCFRGSSILDQSSTVRGGCLRKCATTKQFKGEDGVVV
jgi:hypothetical protein